MQRLTKAEEEIMQMFWDHGPSTVSQLIDRMDPPKPPHSTISSIGIPPHHREKAIFKVFTKQTSK